jgi:hypothetical protein
VVVENKSVVVFIAVRIIAVDFDDFGNKVPAWPAFEIDDDIYRITDIAFDGPVGNELRKPTAVLAGDRRSLWRFPGKR